jgi:hypothetical protein
MLLAIALMYTISKKETIKGYTYTTLGFFTKAFPAIAVPFLFLYNVKATSLKTEVINFGKIFGVAAAVLFIPFFIFNQSAIDTYLFKIGGESRDVFASSITYMAHAWASGVFGVSITTGTISSVFLVILGIVMAFLLYTMYKSKAQDPKLLLKLILVATFTVVTAMQFNSPNYWTWIFPILAILSVDNIYNILLFYATQVIAYCVFPLGFWNLWTNPGYVGAEGSTTWWMALILFTLQFTVMVILIWRVTDPIKMFRETLYTSK